MPDINTHTHNIQHLLFKSESLANNNNSTHFTHRGSPELGKSCATVTRLNKHI